MQHPFRGEGNDFWGNQPPFTPVGSPAGDIYEHYKGVRGHEATQADATEQVRDLLERRLAGFQLDDRPVVNKNPFNSVRIPWLKALFPEAVVIGIYRTPLANVFSLSKKFVEHDKRGRGPEEGWWGVKPNRWQHMINDSLPAQLSSQWNAVNESLLKHRDSLSMLVRYDEFCASPRQLIQSLLALVKAEPASVQEIVPVTFTCQDGEYLEGSRLLSRNRDFVKSGNFDLAAESVRERPPFTAEEMELIQSQTATVLHNLDEVRDRVS